MKLSHYVGLMFLGLLFTTNVVFAESSACSYGYDGSENIQTIQQALEHHTNITVATDGVYGPQTAQAIRNFQRQSNLPVTGVADEPTRFTLHESSENCGVVLGASCSYDGSLDTASIQSGLNTVLGLNLNVDGQFGPQTTAAIQSFQLLNGLVGDGIAGPITRSALEQATCTDSLNAGISPTISIATEANDNFSYNGSTDLRDIQIALNQVQNAGLVTDGISGPATQNAIRTFQANNNLTVDGIPGTNTRNALSAATANNAITTGNTSGVINVVTINNPTETNTVIDDDGVLIGYNMSWRVIPETFTDEFIDNTQALGSEILRYPGGTASHRWDWQNGTVTVRGQNSDTDQPIERLQDLTDSTDTEIIFVLDVVHRTVEDQIEMLQASGVPVNYIELGNELYSSESDTYPQSEYREVYPTGRSYALAINEWIPELRTAFPDAKIGINLLGKTPGVDREQTWNSGIIEELDDIDAYIYHIYVPHNKTVDQRIAEFESYRIQTPGVETWITEYGSKLHDIDQEIQLAEYTESFADISINHMLHDVVTTWSLLEPNAQDFTNKGLAFLAYRNGDPIPEFENTGVNLRTRSAANVTATSAYISGEYISGPSNQNFWIVIKEGSSAPACTSTQHRYDVPDMHNPNANFGVVVNGLASETEYTFRACADGVMGLKKRVTTEEAPESSVTIKTRAATEITENSARINGELQEGADNTSVWFALKKGSTAPTCDSEFLIGLEATYDEGDTFSIEVSELDDNQEYSFRACTSGSEGAKKKFTTQEIPDVVTEPVPSGDLTGLNIKWSLMPNVYNDSFITNLEVFDVDAIRYPGGTVAHKWDWQTGVAINAPNNLAHPIGDLQHVANEVDASVVFVLDVVNSNVEDQIAMLQAANVPVHFIELGNELYADTYANDIPHSAAYGNDMKNNWIPQLRAAFPDVKISIPVVGSTSSKYRKNTWNWTATRILQYDIDAYSYHIYVADGESVDSRIARFEAVYDNPFSRDVWVTEYGVKDGEINKLYDLREYVEGMADISLNHGLITGDSAFSKLSLDGQELTSQGQAFIN